MMTKRYVSVVLAIFWVSGSAFLVSGQDTQSGEASLDFEQSSKQAGVNRARVRLGPKSTGKRRKGRLQDGQLEVTFANGSKKLISGGIGNLEWEREGDTVRARVVSPSGKEIAQVTGIIGKDGIDGKFVDAAGQVGSWKWRGPLPGLP